MDSNFTYDVFVSHSDKDKQVVLELVGRLKNDGLRVWIYEDETQDKLMSAAIAAGLNASRLLLVAWSSSAMESEWIEYEISFFHRRDPANRKGRIVVLRLDETIPNGILEPFAYRKWIDRSPEEYAGLIEGLKEKTPKSRNDFDYARIARIYDYFLGGTFNTPADREAAKALEKKFPDFKDVLVSNRAFLRRAVSYLAENGIKQFLDIGAGLPTRGNTDEIVRKFCPDVKVVYVDINRYVVEASRLLLGENQNNVRVVLGDLGHPERIISALETKNIIDFTKPVGLLLAAVLHFVTDDASAFQGVARLLRELVPGSYVAISHGSRSEKIAHITKPFGIVYRKRVAPVTPRPKAEILRFFMDTALVEPGLVFAPEWHPEISDPYLPAEGLPFAKDPQKCPIIVGIGCVESPSGRENQKIEMVNCGEPVIAPDHKGRD